MGEVFRARDIIKGRRKMMENATRDLSPGVRDAAMQILQSWKGVDSKEELKKLLGKEKALRTMGRIKGVKEE